MKDEDPVDSAFIETARADAEPDCGLVAGGAMHHLARLGRLHRFAPHTVLMVEGDAADTVHVILQGRVKVFSSGPNGSEIVLNICGPGECLGEMALDGGLRSASVIALESVSCSVVSRDALREAITHDPDVALKIIALLIGRARLATDQIKDLALRDVYQRVTRLLQGLAKEHAGVLMVSERLSQQEMADRVGASRDMVARVMRELVGGGYLRMEHKVITLLKKFPARW
jgi:CRP/FNR family transcriptional regulator, cyclic AMP receptor protein